MAQSAMIADDCASVQLVRTKKGDLSITAVVLDSMMTVGFFASVMRAALASRSAVSPPPTISTLSLTIDSWISRFPVSAEDASSLTINSIRLPATMSPCWLI